MFFRYYTADVIDSSGALRGSVLYKQPFFRSVQHAYNRIKNAAHKEGATIVNFRRVK